MEYHVQFGQPIRDPDAVEDAIRHLDPAATVVIDPAAHRLRVSTWFVIAELLKLLAASGNPVTTSQVTELPSTCCGGCSG
ncbi:MAG: hypothetical protein JSR34_01050 [Proteobacteria bacterium]|nr:hypothetical protein [Pseudomonadota bacterium]